MAAIPLTLDALSGAVAGLQAMGVVDRDRAEGVPDGFQSIVLLGPDTEFWTVYQAAPEASDGQPDPVDRWSRRVLDDAATRLDARAVYPFGGPPYAPFLSWALATGRAWQSPVGMLVHDSTGLMVSYRGALAFRHSFEAQVPAENPCDTCADRPCLSACPVGALGAGVYDTKACRDYLTRPAGVDCLTGGCQVRRACPVSAGAKRTAEQSAHHMRYFHRGGTP